MDESANYQSRVNRKSGNTDCQTILPDTFRGEIVHKTCAGFSTSLLATLVSLFLG